MTYDPSQLSRIFKLLIDKDDMLPDEARVRLQSCTLQIKCGADLRSKPGLQAALLTMLNVGARTFLGDISVCMDDVTSASNVLVPWAPGCSLRDAIGEVTPRVQIDPNGGESDHSYLFVLGDVVSTRSDAVRMSYEGWDAIVCPGKSDVRGAEDGRCILAAVLAGALAISEVFMQFADISPYAAKRMVRVPLWVEAGKGTVEGPTIQYLPGEAWLLGLGHLGQAFGWCLSMLPYARPGDVQLILHDYDRVEPANIDTGVLSYQDHVGELKARVVESFLSKRGFKANNVERPFHKGVTVQKGEPALALCGFDGKGPRSALDQANFKEVIECGLGAGHDDFHSIIMHSLPNPARSAADLWPTRATPDSRAESLKNRRFYTEAAKQDHCGHIALANQAIAVPFVGVTAACFAVAESIRALHNGPRYAVLGCDLRRPDRLHLVHLNRDSEVIAFQEVAYGGKICKHAS